MVDESELLRITEEVKRSSNPCGVLKKYLDDPNFSLSIEEARLIMEERFRYHYQWNFWDIALGRKITEDNYPELCGKSGFPAREDFPDW